VKHVYHLYVIRSTEREPLRRALADQEIQTGLHYPVPVHLQPAFADLGYPPGSFPVSEQAAREMLSLPMFPELRADQIERVASVVAGCNHG